VRGPASVLYGSDAVAGVIQIFTRSGGQGRTGPCLVRGGSLGTSEFPRPCSGRDLVTGVVRGRLAVRKPGYLRLQQRLHQLGSRCPADCASRSPRRSRIGRAVGGRRVALSHRFAGVPVDSNQLTRDRALTLSLDAGYQLSGRAELRLLAGLLGTDARFVDTPDSPADDAGYGFDARRRGRGQAAHPGSPQ